LSEANRDKFHILNSSAMFLLIDLSEKDKIHLELFDEKTSCKAEYSGRNRELLTSIDAFFYKQKFDKKGLKGIMAVVGKGSFTNTRISAVVSNVFGYALKIPVMAIAKEQVGQAQKLIPKLKKMPVGQYISAKYSGEPNIG